MTNKQKIFIQVYVFLAILASGLINYQVGIKEGIKIEKLSKVLTTDYHQYVFDYKDGELFTWFDGNLIDDQKMTTWNMSFYTNSKLKQSIDKKPAQDLSGGM